MPDFARVNSLRYSAGGTNSIDPQFGTRCTSTISSLNKQWLDFFQRRVAENLALVEQFMSCRTPVAVWSVYTNFLQSAAEDYQKEFVEFGRLGSVLCSDLVTQKPKKRTSRVDEFRRTQTIQ